MWAMKADFPNIQSNEAIETVLTAIQAAGYKAGSQVAIAAGRRQQRTLECQEKYIFHKSDGKKRPANNSSNTGRTGLKIPHHLH